MNTTRKRKTRDIPDVNKLEDAALVPGYVADVLFGMSRATRYRRIAAKTFPRPRKIGSMSRYVLGELRKQLRADAKAGAQ